jgi:tryptophan-rich sensory protein
MKQGTAIAIAGAAVLAAAAIGSRSGPQEPRAAIWYASLRKPSYTPPGPAIGAAWTLLDALLWVSGARLLRARRGTPRLVALSGWTLTLAGLAGYPWIFFRARQLGGGTAANAAMLAAAGASAVAARRIDPVASLATVPLVGWLAFAGLLSEELWRRNPGRSRAL